MKIFFVAFCPVAFCPYTKIDLYCLYRNVAQWLLDFCSLSLFAGVPWRGVSYKTEVQGRKQRILVVLVVYWLKRCTFSKATSLDCCWKLRTSLLLSRTSGRNYGWQQRHRKVSEKSHLTDRCTIITVQVKTVLRRNGSRKKGPSSYLDPTITTECPALPTGEIVSG